MTLPEMSKAETEAYQKLVQALGEHAPLDFDQVLMVVQWIARNQGEKYPGMDVPTAIAFLEGKLGTFRIEYEKTGSATVWTVWLPWGMTRNTSLPEALNAAILQMRLRMAN